MTYKKEIEASIEEIFEGSELSPLEQAIEYKYCLFNSPIEQSENPLFHEIRAIKLDYCDEIIEERGGFAQDK